MSQTQYSLRQLGWKTYFNQQLTLDELESHTPRRVVKVFRNRLVILGEDGEQDVSLAKFPYLNTCTIGDWLLLSHNPEHQVRILERYSLFQRKAPGADTNQLIAANVDTAFIVTSGNQDFNLSRIERYLALAKEAKVTPVLVLSKIDLLSEEQLDDYLVQLHELEKHMVVLAVNALSEQSCNILLDWCDIGQTVVLLGSSGVGKTTLTNTLCTTQEKTAAIRVDDSKGRHTTSERSLFFTQSGGLILDCPGMRELQLTDCEEGVKAVFADLEQIAQKCKFADCQHHSEPGCAIQQAIKNKILDKRRLLNYQKMLSEQERNSRSVAQSHQQEKKLGKLIKSAQNVKRERYEK
ncbi:MAG: ribosome biogenesis GTPase [Paraglaciecola sp.]|jgi:ribosome biogenesis GTPase